MDFSALARPNQRLYQWDTSSQDNLIHEANKIIRKGESAYVFTGEQLALLYETNDNNLWHRRMTNGTYEVRKRRIY